MKYFPTTHPTCYTGSLFNLYYFLLTIIISITQYHVTTAEHQNKTESCAKLYEKGVDSYLENNFPDCVSNLENAISKYRKYSKKTKNCRLECKKEAEQSEPLHSVDVENLRFYEKILRNTLCIVKCKKDFEGDEGYNMNEDIERAFEQRKPYEYLHLCYFQTGETQKAASAVFTYLVAHPENEMMLKTLKFYSTSDGVDTNEIINYEAKDYVYLYSHGSAAYEEKQWQDVINNMEESLTDFLQAEEECRVQCEGPFDHGWFPDFIPSIANHFTYCLKCKTKCYSKLNSINGEKYEDLLPSHYHYLQYAYFKVGKLKEACKAVASFLLFYPNDETMLSNLEFYMTLPKVEKEHFVPRSEAMKYAQRMAYEKKLSKFITREFQFEPQPNEDIVSKNKPIISITNNSSSQEVKEAMRFVTEGMLSQKQCRDFVNIIKRFSLVGDGYNTTSPHTKMETFEGVTLERAILLAHLGLLNIRHLKMLITASEDAREKVREYFEIEEPLYFTYTHLVCRTSLPGSINNRTDLSHEIHADNCNIYPDGECEKLPPSYTWRDYSAIVYLNNNFKGGEFFFSSNTKPESIQSFITPSCGKMVAFSSGAENLHGVKAVKEGFRCALALWFTLDENYREKERDIAFDMTSKEF